MSAHTFLAHQDRGAAREAVGVRAATAPALKPVPSAAIGPGVSVPFVALIEYPTGADTDNGFPSTTLVALPSTSDEHRR